MVLGIVKDLCPGATKHMTQFERTLWDMGIVSEATKCRVGIGAVAHEVPEFPE